MSGGGFGLGNIGSSLGKIAGSALKPVNLAGSAIGSMGGVGGVLGPALQLAGGASPLGVFGSSLAGEVLKGYTEKGGSADRPLFVDATGNPIYAQRGYNYGANTYRVSDNPFDASKYFISGDKGVYNLLPMLGGLYGDKQVAARPGASSYNIYNDIYSRMADDAAAQKAFSERFGVKEINPLDLMDPQQRSAYTTGITPFGFGKAKSVRNPFGSASQDNANVFGGTLFGSNIPSGALMGQGDNRQIRALRNTVPTYLQSDIDAAFGEYNPLSNFMSSGKRFKAPTINPIKYVDFGFGADATNKNQPFELLADYASQNKNPFFLAYEPIAASATTTTPAPTMDSASALTPTTASAPVSVPELAPFTAPVPTIAPTPTIVPTPTAAPVPTPTTAPARVSAPVPMPTAAPARVSGPVFGAPKGSSGFGVRTSGLQGLAALARRR